MLGTAVGHASGGQLLAAAVRAVEPTIIQGLEYPVGVPLEIDMVEPEKEAEPVPVRILNVYPCLFCRLVASTRGLNLSPPFVRPSDATLRSRRALSTY